MCIYIYIYIYPTDQQQPTARTKAARRHTVVGEKLQHIFNRSDDSDALKDCGVEVTAPRGLQSKSIVRHKLAEGNVSNSLHAAVHEGRGRRGYEPRCLLLGHRLPDVLLREETGYNQFPSQEFAKPEDPGTS